MTSEQQRPTDMPERNSTDGPILRLTGVAGVAYVVAETGEAINNRALEIIGKVVGLGAVALMGLVAGVGVLRARREGPSPDRLPES